MVWMAVLVRTFSSGILAGAPVRYVTKTWNVVLLNKKKHIYPCLKCVVYDKFLKPRQSFRITLYFALTANKLMALSKIWNELLLFRNFDLSLTCGLGEEPWTALGRPRQALKDITEIKETPSQDNWSHSLDSNPAHSLYKSQVLLIMPWRCSCLLMYVHLNRSYMRWI